MSTLSNFISSAFATVAQALLGTSLTSLMSPYLVASVTPRKNYIVNPSLWISQQNGSTAGTTDQYYPVDQFNVNYGAGGAISVAQVVSVTPYGSPHRVRITVTTASTTITSGQYLTFGTRLEGRRVAPLGFGTNLGKTLTLKFGTKAPAGTYCVSFVNGAGNRGYVLEYTISASEANTDVYKTLTLTADTSGTWDRDTGNGLNLSWGLASGTSNQVTPNVWSGSGAFSTSNQFNLLGTVNNVFELFDVGLYEGATAPPYIVPDSAAELLACQRYYEEIGMTIMNISGAYYNQSWYKAIKRTTPTLTVIAGNIQGGVVSTVAYSPLAGCRQTGSSSAASDILIAANARL